MMHAVPRHPTTLRIPCQCMPSILSHRPHPPGCLQPFKASAPLLLLASGCSCTWVGRGARKQVSSQQTARLHPVASCHHRALLRWGPPATGKHRKQRQPPPGSYPCGQPGAERRALAPTGECSGEPGSPVGPGWALPLGKGQARYARNRTRGTERERSTGCCCHPPSPPQEQYPGVPLPVTPQSPEYSAKICQHLQAASSVLQYQTMPQRRARHRLGYLCPGSAVSGTQGLC